MLETDILVVIKLYYLQLLSFLQLRTVLLLRRDRRSYIGSLPINWSCLEVKEFGLLFERWRFILFSVQKRQDCLTRRNAKSNIEKLQRGWKYLLKG